eukprot:584519-Hanusia_phi.AAC.2
MTRLGGGVKRIHEVRVKVIAPSQETSQEAKILWNHRQTQFHPIRSLFASYFFCLGAKTTSLSNLKIEGASVSSQELIPWPSNSARTTEKIENRKGRNRS